MEKLYFDEVSGNYVTIKPCSHGHSHYVLYAADINQAVDNGEFTLDEIETANDIVLSDTKDEWLGDVCRECHVVSR